jgi:dihydrofolate reductase
VNNPLSTENDVKFSRYAENTHKIVFSKTLKKVGWKNTKLIKNNIAEEIKKLKKQSGKNLALVGGAGIAQFFMNLDLVDDYWITVHPVILGQGKPLFKNVNYIHKLYILGVKPFKSGAVGLFYTKNTKENV